MLRSRPRGAVRGAIIATTAGLLLAAIVAPGAATAAPPAQPRVLYEQQGCTFPFFQYQGIIWAIPGCSDGRFYSDKSIVVTFTGNVYTTNGQAPPPKTPVALSLDMSQCDGDGSHDGFTNHFFSHLRVIPGLGVTYDRGYVAISPSGKVVATCLGHTTSLGPFTP